jgi:hypothetical protein
MELERKAIYNLLRMNQHETNSCAPWQIENYRSKPIDLLFKELSTLGLALDSRHFTAHAEAYDTPEEFSDALISEEKEAKESDHLFLIIFELWRRLVPEKRSISILCDDLDEFIHQFDQGLLTKEEDLQDALSSLITLLEENLDAGLKPSDLFNVVQANTANDLESFLFDFISEKIDEEEIAFAAELLDDFMPFVKDKIWFEFLKAKVLSFSDQDKANELINKLHQDKYLDVELALELLEFLAHFGDQALFLRLAKKTVPLIEFEDEFQDLLLITEKYFSCLDLDEKEEKVSSLLKKRSKKNHEAELDKNDTDVKAYLNLL